jgi:butyryl-CoA dehydrogenase
MSRLLRELEFHLGEVLGLSEVLKQPRFGDIDRGIATAMLEAAAELAEAKFAPCAARLDADEPRWEGGRVVLPLEAGEALRAYVDAGFPGTAFPRPLGGLGLPFLLSQACGALFAAANVSLYSYPMLTQGAANVIARYGSEAQRRRYLPALLSGGAFGTMCLSEPQAGSSLADIRTSATPAGERQYSLRGRKMWISGGEHELAGNIIHLVLARVPGGPPGVKGLSLFIVPRYRLDAAGGAGEANGVGLIGLNHKMGWRGHVNTALSFGDTGECLGELVGREHEGLGYMFHLMNEARVAVGLCAVALAHAGYQYSLDYARTRLQGRPLGGRDPLAPPIPIIGHPDVRRMLLAQKAWVEGGMGLVLYCARLVDELGAAPGSAEAEKASLLLELLTPIAKSWPAEHCLEANKLAIQVAGGAGYTRDLPLERLYRDNRLNQIHEGSYGIHGLDLLGRKVRMSDGRALQAFLGEVQHTIREALHSDELRAECRALASAVQALAATTRRLLETLESGEAERALSNATLYLDAFGTIAVAWRWLAQAGAALRGLPADPGGVPDGARPQAEGSAEVFRRGKLAACRFFFRHDLPRARAQLALLASLDDTALNMRDDQF